MISNYQQISLATKPSSRITYRFEPAESTIHQSKHILLVFLNGIGLSQDGWNGVLERLNIEPRDFNILTYDRYGQGRTTDQHPEVGNAKDPMHSHDCRDVVHDLKQLINQIIEERIKANEMQSIFIVFVAVSIGSAIARLYAQENPGSVAGLLLIDSVMANSDFISVFPEPDAIDFRTRTLPPGVTLEGIQQAREGCLQNWHPRNGSKEGLSRKNLRDLLPSSTGPSLTGPRGEGPWVTVVGHDHAPFAEETAKIGIPKECTLAYVNPNWDRYNNDLLQITQIDRRRGPLLAPNAGHFVPEDNPAFIAAEIAEILVKIRSS